MTKRQKVMPVRIVHEPGSSSEPYRPKDSLHMSVRQIDNGFIINRHGYKNGKHFDNERFSATAPRFEEPSKPRSSGRSTRLRNAKL